MEVVLGLTDLGSIHPPELPLPKPLLTLYDPGTATGNEVANKNKVYRPSASSLGLQLTPGV